MIGTVPVLGVTTGSEVSESTAIGFYLVYAAVAVALVVFLARTLNRNGKIFLQDTFEDSDVAQAVNSLLVVGFYLLNLGYALTIYRLQPSYESLTSAFSELTVKLGLLSLSLGAIHFVNMFVFWKIRTYSDSDRDRTSQVAKMSPPSNLPPPSAFVPPPPAAGPLPTTSPGSPWPV